MRRLIPALALAGLAAAGCGDDKSYFTMYDFAREPARDLAATGDGGGTDDAGGIDDAAMSDDLPMNMQDLAVEKDLTMTVVPDLSAPKDMTMSPLNDLSSPPDLTTTD